MNAFFENSVNTAYIAGSALILISAVLTIFSYRRYREKENQLTKLQLDTQRRVAEANQRAEAASEAAASAAGDREQLRIEILALSVELERERTLRLKMEERVLRQAPVGRVNPEGPPRVLTAGQEEEGVRIMREFAGTVVCMIEIEDPEAGPLAGQIQRIVRGAELQVEVCHFAALVPSQYGIICTHGPGEAAAVAFVKMMRGFDLVVYERAGTAGEFEIVVGLRV
jgi:hypothetical protein